jgi:hypothetical protein
MRRRGVLAALLGGSILSGSLIAFGATWPPYRRDGPLPQGKGRIYIYRLVTRASANRNPLLINGKPIGAARPGSYFYVDCPAGHCEIDMKANAGRMIAFDLTAGQIRYIRIGARAVMLGTEEWPELIDDDTGEAEMRSAEFAPPMS